MASETELDNMASQTELRLMMVGPTGSGKSSTANTIMMTAIDQDRPLYQTGQGTDAVTHWNEGYTRLILGRMVTVVDTPGADNTRDDPSEILQEIRAAVEKSDQPYDAILYVVDVFKTKLQLDDLTLKIFQQADSVLGPEFWKHCVLIFTYRNEFTRQQEDNRSRGMAAVTFDEFIRKDKVSRNNLAIGPYVKQVNDAAVLIENSAERNSNIKVSMVEDILKKVEAVKLSNNGIGFSKEQLKADPVYPVKIPAWKRAYDTVKSHLAENWKNYIMVFLMIAVLPLIKRACNTPMLHLAENWKKYMMMIAVMFLAYIVAIYRSG